MSCHIQNQEISSVKGQFTELCTNEILVPWFTAILKSFNDMIDW